MKQSAIPINFLIVKYNGQAYPGSEIADGIKNGANCQHFIYEIYRYNGLDIPNFRSSDIWEDTEYTVKIDSFQPFDILFFNLTKAAWGAHLGMYLGDNRVIHLSKVVGYPAVWELKEFQKHREYKTFIGAKRLKSVNI